MGVRSERLAARPGLVTFLGYLSAAAVAVSVFIYLTFPWEKLSFWFEGKMEERLGMEISIGEREINFPFHLVWNDVTISGFRGSFPLTIQAEDFSVEWPFQAILGRRLEIDISTHMFGGEFRGKLASQKVKDGVQYRLTGAGEEFDIGALSAVFQVPVADLKGTIRVPRLEHEWVNQNWRVGEGLIVLEASNVETQQYSVSLNEVKGRVVLKSGMANMEDISARGESIDLVGSGSIYLHPTFSNSLLDFNSRLTLTDPTGLLAILATMASSEGGMDLAFRGPLRRPVPYLNGKPLPVIGLDLSRFDESKPQAPFYAEGQVPYPNSRGSHPG